MTAGFKREDAIELDEFDIKVVETAMRMSCNSFFYTVQRIMQDFDIPKEHMRIAEEAVRDCAEHVWETAYKVAEECSDETASLFTSAFMVNMALELVDHTLKTQLLMEADDILNGE